MNCDRAIFEPKRIRSFGRVRVVVLACLATLGFLILGESRADATCGDYLSHHEAAADRSSRALSNVELAGAIPHSDDIPGRRPCNGPFCSQGSDQSPLAPPLASVETQDRWVWTFEVTQAAQTESSYVIRHGDQVPLPSIPFRLDRPPKV